MSGAPVNALNLLSLYLSKGAKATFLAFHTTLLNNIYLFFCKVLKKKLTLL